MTGPRSMIILFALVGNYSLDEFPKNEFALLWRHQDCHHLICDFTGILSRSL